MALNFPDSPTLNQVYSAGGKTWSYNGSRWVLVIATAIIDVADGSITAAKIADGTIVAAEIANSAITTAKINNNAVTQAKLASNLSAVTVTTTANRDTDIPSPFTGQLAVLTDTRKIQLYDGTSWVNVSLAPPETPTSLSATALSTTSVSIAFTAGGANGSPITNYKYALSTNGGSTYGSFIALSPEDITTPITISGLTAATAYYFKLKAVNDMGDSVASAAVSISTLATPDAPTSLSAGSITLTSVAISFTPGAQGGSAISNYQYALSTNGGSTYGSFTALSPADATSPITISGLTHTTAYYVKLKAVNTDGAGTESSAVSFSTTAYPSAVDYLVVAGGGSGGSSAPSAVAGGGGGAGGFRTDTAFAVLFNTSYTVTVGAGGTPTTDTRGTSGTNSVFSTITSTGGGAGGGGGAGPAGLSGGSGGGSVGWNAGTIAGGTGNTPSTSPSQGNNGGTGGGTYTNGAGGGGASGNGENYNDAAGGTGGLGTASSITGSSVTYAGGGGGGGSDISSSGFHAGGTTTGGGGAGGSSSSRTGLNGTANTGGGAGGCGALYPTGGTNVLGGNGGSGIVILRYADTLADITTIGAGLTYTFANTGGYKIYSFTAGSGSITI